MSKTKRVSGQGGVTIIELMIYMSILTIVLVVMTNFVIDVSANGAKTKITKDVQQNGQLILGRLTQDIRTAISIAPVVQTNQLDLVNTDGAAMTYNWDGHDVTANGTVLNAANIRVTNLIFTEQGGTVNISVTVEQAATSVRAAERAQSTLTSSVVSRRSIYN